MNYNQQIQEQGYNCDGCCRTILAGKEKRHCLDDNQGIKMSCVLCPACDYSQFSTKRMTGLFPLLAGIEKPSTGLKEIITPEFKRHEEAETRFQQQQIKSQQPPSQFNCDKCHKAIPFAEEKEHFLARYKPNTSVVSDVRWRVLCSPCEKPLNKDLVPNTILSQADSINKTQTFLRYQEYKERVKEQSNPMAPMIKRGEQLEEERQAKMKGELEKWGF